MAKLSQLLLYDPDPSGLETLSYVFLKDGCPVTATSDATKVPELLQTLSAPLVLVALREPAQTGLDLIRELTGNPRTRNLACVAIGPAQFRAAAMQVGAFGLLSSPVFLRDVLDASKLVAAATLPGSRPSPDSEVSLELSELGGIYYLIRAIAAAGRSAAVEVQRGARRGELRFIDGELSSAQLGAITGLSALHQLLLWDEAELRLKFRNIVRRGGQLTLKGEALIEECDRFLRDFAHDVRELGVARTIYRQRAGAVQPTSALPSEVVPLLRLFDGTRTLGQILDESPFRVFDTLRIVRQFATAEAIRADAPPSAPPAVGVAPGPAALAAWLQQQTPSVDEAEQVTPPPQPVAEPQTTVAAGAPRPSSPFIPVAPAATDGVPTKVAKRTVTRRDYPIKSPTDAVPAPMTTGAIRSTPLPNGMTRGEIRTSGAPAKLGEKGVRSSGPSVLVELGSIPQTRPPDVATAAPLTAQLAAPAIAVPLVVPKTPVPVVNRPPRKKTPMPGHGEPSHRTRTPSSGFSAVEADFFEREADLYKRESAENFDDLEGGPRGPGPSRKR
jgi:CheY-like chemotaxis protein